MNERPDWRRGDTLKSSKEVAAIGFGALKECLLDIADWIDTRAANKINGENDE